ncbi:MAG: ribonuclease P protein component [Vicinamibacterales bacterium]
MPSHSFTKTQRVRRRDEFQQVFKSGYRVGSRYFTLLLAPHPGAAPRLGIVASKKLGDAVHRNRAKRLIRELFRHTESLPVATTGIDLIVIPRRELFGASFAELDRDFRTAWQRGSARMISAANAR